MQYGINIYVTETNFRTLPSIVLRGIHFFYILIVSSLHPNNILMNILIII